MGDARCDSSTGIARRLAQFPKTVEVDWNNETSRTSYKAFTNHRLFLMTLGLLEVAVRDGKENALLQVLALLTDLRSRDWAENFTTL